MAALIFVRPSVRSSVTKLLNTIFWKQINRFRGKLVYVVRGAKTWNGKFSCVRRSKVKVTGDRS